MPATSESTDLPSLIMVMNTLSTIKMENNADPLSSSELLEMLKDSFTAMRTRDMASKMGIM